VVCRLGLPLLPPPVNVLFAVAAFGVAVVASVFVFQLAMHLYGRATGIVLGVLTLIPVLGIITLLVLNAKATSTLRQHGVKVGLLGADLSEL
jgi:hypothetical protein